VVRLNATVAFAAERQVVGQTELVISMAEIVVRRIEPLDEEVLEEWQRVTDEKDILGVGASLVAGQDWPWTVFISVAEFIRREPLQTQLRSSMTGALNGVPGVLEALQDDRETWLVRGQVGGEALVRAGAAVVDRLAGATRAELLRLARGR
jgi:hypothetical protein